MCSELNCDDGPIQLEGAFNGAYRRYRIDGLPISLSLFPDDCKIAKLKPLYKKEAKT